MFRSRGMPSQRRVLSCGNVTVAAEVTGASACARVNGEIEFHMQRPFFTSPILNSPYERPSRHWEFDAGELPTGRVLRVRRHVTLVTPIQRPKTKSKQQILTFDRTPAELETKHQQYEVA